jgi:hypothetical protein
VIAFLRQSAEQLEQPIPRRLLIALFIVLATIFTLLPFFRFLHSGTQFDYRTWFDAAQAILQNQELYPHSNTFPFMYPPTCALLLAVPAAFGKPAMILILTILNTSAWLLCIKFSLALTNEPRYRTAITLVSNLVVIVFIWSSYHLGQPSLLLLALMLGACLCLRRNRQVSAGALVALATAIKAFPFLALVYLLYRRYWTAAVSLVLAVLSLLFVLPMPMRGVQQTLADFRAWQNGMLRYREGGIAQRQARGYSWKNQSIFGLANRLLRRVSVNDEGEAAEYFNLANLDFRQVNAVILLLALLLGGWFALALSRTVGQTEGLEFAALLILILLFTPLSFGYLFSWLMLPICFLTRELLRRRSTAAAVSLATGLALLVSTAISPRFAQIYGSLFFASLALYLGVTTELWRPGKVVVAGDPDDR